MAYILCYFVGSFLSLLLLLDVAASSHTPKLTPNYYEKSCPAFQKIVKDTLQEAIDREQRSAASILRLHFHDCMVNGCDASILLDPAPGIDSEKVNVTANASLREVAFDTIDHIKSKVDSSCGSSVVSCADILAVAARDSVTALGGPTWQVLLGRRDSRTASSQLASDSLPTPIMELPELVRTFKKQRLSKKDLVALSGGHTLGFSSCVAFRQRIYNGSNIDPEFAKLRRLTCPASGGDANIAQFDDTPYKFDTQYFKDLVEMKGLLESDQALYNGGSTEGWVRKYRANSEAFSEAFVASMIKLGNLKPPSGSHGEIRLNCRKIN